MSRSARNKLITGGPPRQRTATLSAADGAYTIDYQMQRGRTGRTLVRASTGGSRSGSGPRGCALEGRAALPSSCFRHSAACPPQPCSVIFCLHAFSSVDHLSPAQPCMHPALGTALCCLRPCDVPSSDCLPSPRALTLLSNRRTLITPAQLLSSALMRSASTTSACSRAARSPAHASTRPPASYLHPRRTRPLPC